MTGLKPWNSANPRSIIKWTEDCSGSLNYQEILKLNFIYILRQIVAMTAGPRCPGISWGQISKTESFFLTLPIQRL